MGEAVRAIKDNFGVERFGLTDGSKHGEEPGGHAPKEPLSAGCRRLLKRCSTAPARYFFIHCQEAQNLRLPCAPLDRTGDTEDRTGATAGGNPFGLAATSPGVQIAGTLAGIES